MTRKQDIVETAARRGRDKSSRIWLLLLALLATASLIATVVAVLYAFDQRDEAARQSQRAQQLAEAQKDEAQSEADVAVAGADAAGGYLRAACKAGDRDACKLRAEIDSVLKGLQDVRNSREIQEGEVQEGEIQEPEIQEPDSNDPERDDPESQEAEQQEDEAQEAEEQEGEVQDAEEQEAEVQDPEIQEPEEQEAEQQDPEVDDPDPNSGLQFSVGDNCSPPAGSYVSDISLSVSRGDGVVTYTVNCATAPLPAPGNSGNAGPE